MCKSQPELEGQSIITHDIVFPEEIVKEILELTVKQIKVTRTLQKLSHMHKMAQGNLGTKWSPLSIEGLGQYLSDVHI